ncbi:hypothetical protein [Brevibacillus laterosporus]|uniref:hypothetical protein n=1 Tax=Brevibacillus laterosporus TaxID=1465 RepID=UPI003D232C3A
METETSKTEDSQVSEGSADVDGGEVEDTSAVDFQPLINHWKSITPVIEKEELPSGEIHVVHSVTYGDILIVFAILLLVATKIAKWVWEATK